MNHPDLAGLQALVGARVPVPSRPHVEYATLDTIRAFARNTGDANPLYGDPVVAARSVHGGLIAPPMFPIATGSPAPGERVADDPLASLRGRHFEVIEDRWTFGPPVRPGTRLDRVDTLHAVAPCAPDAFDITTRATFAAHGVVHATQDRVRRYASSPPTAHASVPRMVHRYTDAEIDAIEAEIARWSRRGPAPRLAGTVHHGDVIGPLVKGPLTLTDLVSYRAGVGAGPFDVEPLELAIENRRLRPGFYDRGATNAWDARERLHWDEAYAISQGHPTAYDYSHTRLVWSAQLLTDWMGDAGRLERIGFRRLADNYVGDTHWLRGEVCGVELGVDDRHGRVEVRIDARNQLGASTALADASVLLPVR